MDNHLKRQPFLLILSLLLFSTQAVEAQDCWSNCGDEYLEALYRCDDVKDTCFGRCNRDWAICAGACLATGGGIALCEGVCLGVRIRCANDCWDDHDQCTSWATQDVQGCWDDCQYWDGEDTSPIILDLDGMNGILLSSLEGGVQFDIDADGRAESVSWTLSGEKVDIGTKNSNPNMQAGETPQLHGILSGRHPAGLRLIDGSRFYEVVAPRPKSDTPPQANSTQPLVVVGHFNLLESKSLPLQESLKGNDLQVERLSATGELTSTNGEIYFVRGELTRRIEKLHPDSLELLEISGYADDLEKAKQGIQRDTGVQQGSNSDAFLALDRNGNGVIDDGSELFGNATPLIAGGLANHGFEALAELDQGVNGGNDNNRIDAGDNGFRDLLLWTDFNHNGVSEGAELQTASDAGLQWIDLNVVENRKKDRYGNEFRFNTNARVKVNGHTRTVRVSDVFLLGGNP